MYISTVSHSFLYEEFLGFIEKIVSARWKFVIYVDGEDLLPAQKLGVCTCKQRCVCALARATRPP